MHLCYVWHMWHQRSVQCLRFTELWISLAPQTLAWLARQLRLTVVLHMMGGLPRTPWLPRLTLPAAR